MVVENITRTAAAVKLIDALGGDPRTGMCCCPAHDDESPSLSVTETANGKVLWHCFAGCEQAAVTDALRAKGFWPITNGAATGPVLARRRRTDDERREFALKILADTEANRGREIAEGLDLYFAGRGIKTVPATAMLALPWHMNPDKPCRLLPDGPAMIFAVTDGQKIVGAHVTWLSPDVTAKREEEPKRQFFGPVGGGFIRLYAELDPKAKLVIAEGVETALAAAQIAGGLPAIAALSAKNLPKITPPLASEFIIAADNDAPGLAGARALAVKLVRAGHRARLAVPPEAGADWNDVIRKTKEN